MPFRRINRTEVAKDNPQEAKQAGNPSPQSQAIYPEPAGSLVVQGATTNGKTEGNTTKADAVVTGCRGVFSPERKDWVLTLEKSTECDEALAQVEKFLPQSKKYLKKRLMSA